MARERILIVDDEESVAITMQAILEMDGHDVSTASSVADATALVQASEYDLVLSDLRLGDGDGIQIVLETRRRWPETVCIILTGYASLDSAVKALRELPKTDFTTLEPFGWLCHLAEQCIVDGHRHFSAGKRASSREMSGNIPVGEGSQDLVALLAASMTTPTQAVVRNEREQRLLDALATFPDEHREVLRLRYVDGLATKDIAARVHKSDVAIRVLLSRLIHRLQELLEPGEE